MGKCNIITCKIVELKANKTLKKLYKTKTDLYTLFYNSEKQFEKCEECALKNNGKQIKKTRNKTGKLYVKSYWRKLMDNNKS